MANLYPTPTTHITTNDLDTGKSKFHASLTPPPFIDPVPSLRVHYIYSTTASADGPPVKGDEDLKNYEEMAREPRVHFPTAAGTGGCLVHFAPNAKAEKGYMHTTSTLDYIFILDGSLELGLESGGHGATACGKYPGEWFGPSATAQCIQALTSSSGLSLNIYSPNDGQDVYEDGFMKIAKSDGQTFNPTLILIRTRLGIDKITPIYWNALIAALHMPQSVGIAGGRPASSHYFVGSQGSYLFYLDPHHTRKAIPYHDDVTKYAEEDIESCHTSRLRRIHIKEMDPSMLIGFLIRTESDWTEWRQCVENVQGKNIIHVADHEPVLYSGEGRDGAVDEVELLSDDDDMTAT